MTSSPPLPWLRPPERSPVPPDPRDVRIADLLQTDPAGAHVAVIGIPFDTAVIGRRGAREAPAAIRRALYRMTAFDLESGVDLAEGLRLVDLGDVAVVHTDIHETHRRVTAVLREVTRQGLRFPGPGRRSQPLVCHPAGGDRRAGEASGGDPV